MSKIADMTEKYRRLVDDDNQPLIQTAIGPAGAYDELYGELYLCAVEHAEQNVILHSACMMLGAVDDDGKPQPAELIDELDALVTEVALLKKQREEYQLRIGDQMETISKMACQRADVRNAVEDALVYAQSGSRGQVEFLAKAKQALDVIDGGDV